MATDNFVGVGVGIVTAFSAMHAMVKEANGAEWQVPRAHIPPTIKVGDRVTLCALPDGGVSRDEIARALLNQLLGGSHR